MKYWAELLCHFCGTQSYIEYYKMGYPSVCPFCGNDDMVENLDGGQLNENRTRTGIRT